MSQPTKPFDMVMSQLPLLSLQELYALLRAIRQRIADQEARPGRQNWSDNLDDDDWDDLAD
jgi:hypothetical protein